MRLLDYLTGILSLLALPFIAWWGVNQSPQSATRLEARLQSNAAQALQLAGVSWAEVDMDGQTAILTGPSPSEDAVAEAASVVLRSSGSGGLLFGGVSQVQTRVHPAEPVWPYIWSAEKKADGSVVLSGYVPSHAARDALRVEADAVGKGRVVDNTILAMGAPEGNWQGIARFAILQLQELKEGRAELANHELTLRGTAADDAARLRLTDATRAVAAPFRGVALLNGAALWSARLDAGALVLSGAVARDADRRALLAQARRSFTGDIRDEMVVEPSADAGWIEGAVAGLAQFSAFERGRMTFDPVIGGFTFDGVAPPSTLQFLDEDMLRAAGAGRYVIAASAAGVAAPAQAQSAPANPCQDVLNASLASGAVSFQSGGALFNRASGAALDAFASSARNCGALELSVDADALNQSRAGAIADFLERSGVRRPRIAAIAYGPATGGQGMDSGKEAPGQTPFVFTSRE